MAVCECCGNDYDKPIEVTVADGVHLFDCFECAVHLLAPVCQGCGCRIIGHGVEDHGNLYCCGACAAAAGAVGLKDRV